MPLARAGIRATGVDLSSAMLGRARVRAQQAGLERWITLVHDDARRMELGTRFPLVIIALNTFMHFTSRESQQAALGRIARHLVPGGILAFEVCNPHPDLLEDADGRLIHDFTRHGPDEGSVTTRFHSQRVDPATQTLDITFFYDEADRHGVIRRTVAPFGLRYVTAPELEWLLPACGFAIENVYGGFDLTDYRAESSRMVVVARRS